MDSIFELAVIIKAIDQISGPIKSARKVLGDFDKWAGKADGMVRFGERAGVASAFIGASAAKMRGALGEILGPLTEVEDSMAKVQSVITPMSGDMAASMANMKAAALDWSKAHTDSATEFLDTSYMMLSAGLNEAAAVEATRTAMAVATATMGDNVEAADLMARVYNNLGDQSADVAGEMSRLGDILTKTQQTFQIANLNQLATGLQYGIPVAKQFGISVEQVNASIGMLNTLGLQGSMAGTAFAATMRNMIKASGELGFEMARTASGGIDFVGTVENIRAVYGDFSKMTDRQKTAFQKAFGDEGLRAVSVLLGKTGELRSALGTVTGSAGATTAAMITMESTSSAQFRILHNNLDAVKVTIGEHLLPMINRGIPIVQKLITNMGRFAEAHPGLMKIGVSLLAIMAVLLSIIAPILSVGAGFMLMGGYGLKAVLGVVSALQWLLRIMISGSIQGAAKSIGVGFRWGFGLARTAVLRSVTVLRAFSLGVLQLARQALIALIGVLPGLIASVWAFTAALLANPITWVVLAVVGLGAGLWALIKHWDTVKVAFMQAVDWIMGFGKQMYAAGAALFASFTEGLKSLASKPVEFVKNTLGKIRAMLPFSDAKMGPLADLSRSGEAFNETLSRSIEKSSPRLISTVKAELGELLPQPAPAAAPAAETGSGERVINININGAAPNMIEQIAAAVKLAVEAT